MDHTRWCKQMDVPSYSILATITFVCPRIASPLRDTPEGELLTSVDRRRTEESATSGNIPEEGTPTGDVDGSARDNEGAQTGELPTEDTHSGNEQTADEYVFERIVGTKQADDGTMLYRVRLFGYTRDDDTWEPQEHLPVSALRRYNRRIWLPMPQ
jgi:hypothetical protein